MSDPLIVLKVVATTVMVGSILAARFAPPPPRRPTGLVGALCLFAVAGCVAGALGAAAGTVLVACSVEASCAAMWLLRAPRTDSDDDDGGGGGGGGGKPPGGRDPDAPDPAAFDWDAFERAGRTPVGAAH